MAYETKNYHGKYFLTIVFASILFTSFGVIHNAFADQVIATIPVGNNPYGIGVNPNTNMIYVSNFGNNTVSVIDGSTNNVVSTIPLGNFLTRGLVVNPVTNMIYVFTRDSLVYPTVVAIDGSTNTIANTIRIPTQAGSPQPFGITVNSVTNMIYGADYTGLHFGRAGSPGGWIAIMNGTTNTYVNSTFVKGFPNGIAVNQKTNKIYSADFAGYSPGPYSLISVMDGSTNSVVDSINVTRYPSLVAVNPNTNMIYATDTSGKLEVIDGTTDSIVNEIPINNPTGITINLDANKIYVSSQGNSSNITVIDGPSNQVLGAIPVESSPNELAINPNTNRIYVANYQSNTVSVIDATIPTTTPQPPTNLSATTISSSQINLSWTAPSNNAGAAIIGYEIERSVDNGSTWSTLQSNTGSTGTTYSDTGLSPDTTYTYRVSAINSVGTGNPSNISSATTLAILTVITKDVLGNAITGIWIELHSANGDTIATGYTPVKFDVVQNTQYAVYAANYLNYVFLHWNDGSMSNPKNTTPTGNETLTATYTP